MNRRLGANKAEQRSNRQYSHAELKGICMDVICIDDGGMRRSSIIIICCQVGGSTPATPKPTTTPTTTPFPPITGFPPLTFQPTTMGGTSQEGTCTNVECSNPNNRAIITISCCSFK